MQRPESYQGNHPYIFVSYAHQDTQRVLPIISRLLEDGHRVWYDNDIRIEENWDDFLAKKIISCSLFLSFVSKPYVLSENCIDELRFAEGKKKSKVLVYLEEAELPLGLQMRIGTQQAVLWYNYPDKAQAYAKLYDLEDVQRTRLSPNAHLTADELYARANELRKTATAESVTEAFASMRLAAELGHPKAMTDVAIDYHYGHYTEKNIKKALHWYQQAAQEGEADAMFYLAQLYLDGDEVPQNTEEALHWFHLAVKHGHEEAILALGDIYREGKIGPPDLTAAIDWYMKLATVPHRPRTSDCQHYLGVCYDQLGDYDAARHWYTKAMQNGDAYSILCLHRLDGQ